VAISPKGSPLVQAAKEHEEVFANLPAYVHEAILRAYINGAVTNTLREEEMQLYLEPWLGGEGQKAFWRQVAQMSDKYTEEIEWRYSEIRCPVSILRGEQDEWISLEHGRQLASRIPSSTFQIAPNAMHLVQEDAPEATMATVLNFWSNIEGQ